ncbi:MAG: Gfo/Idh/MocA family oxidoreductase [Devosiaceae bacterium]|nr:Gfo/Idh/MocA family oxidoreductase [Devosiaceae bacterium MH13]
MPQTAQIALAGYGLVGRRHVEAIEHSGEATLAAIIEPNESYRAEASALGVPLFADLSAFFGRGKADGVILATPNQLHVEQALACLDAGLPVLVEKPIATRSQDAAELVKRSEATGLPVLVGHHRRHNPIIKEAKRAIEGGAIGTIRAVHAQCWLYKPDSYFEEADWRKRPGAGPIAVNLVHDIDLLRHLCGEVSTVRAIASPALRGYDNEDVAGALLGFASGAVGTVTVSDSIVAPWSWEFTARENPAYPATQQSSTMIGGSHGSLSLPDLTLWSNGQAEQHWWSPLETQRLGHKPSDPLVNQIDHFADVIAGRSEPLVSAREGMRSLEVVEAIQQAAASGDMVHLD